jgi:hypothetical protein
MRVRPRRILSRLVSLENYWSAELRLRGQCYYNVFDLVITLHLSYVLYDTSSTTRMIDHLSAAGNLNLQQRDYSSTTVIIL